MPDLKEPIAKDLPPDTESGISFTARREERDEKLRELLRQATNECRSPIIAESTALALKGKADLYRLRFDIIMALYQDVGW